MADFFKLGGLGGVAEALLGDIQNGFKAGFVLELYDRRKNQALETFVFVINPTRYELSEPFQVELTPAEDNTVVAEENGIIVREITLEGTFGLKERSAVGFQGGQGDGKPLSGDTHFIFMRNMFRRYSKMKKDPKTAPYTEMIFHALKDDDHYQVIPREFRSPRDARTARVHRVFSLKMTAVDGPDHNPTKIKDPKKRSGGVLDKFAEVQKALGDVRSQFAEATANLARIRRATFGNVDAIFTQTAGLIRAVGNFVRGIQTTFIDAPIQLFTTLSGQLERLADELAVAAGINPDSNRELRNDERTIRSISSSLDRVAQFAELFQSPSADRGKRAAEQYRGENRLTREDIQNETAGATLGTQTRISQGSARDNGLSLGSLQGFGTWVIGRADSVQSIANATSSTPEAIVLINNMKYPYISEAGGPGIYKPGDKILVPGPQSGAAEDGVLAAPGQDGYFTAEDALYGIDGAIDQDLLNEQDVLELLVDTVHGAEDMLLVRGVRNVIQGLTIALNTELTATAHVPDVGMRPAIGTKGTIQHLLLASINLRDVILDDDRIESIDELSVVLDKDVLSQDLRPRLIDGRNITVSVPFGRASGAGSTVVR